MRRVLPGILLLLGLVLGFGLAHLWPKPAARTSATATGGNRALTVTIAALVDGSERFVFTRDNVWDDHGQWQPPKEVTFNGEPWPDLAAPPPQWDKLAANLDLSKAVLLQRKGRDIIALEKTAEGFDLYFADTQMGAAPYEATISIPLK